MSSNHVCFRLFMIGTTAPQTFHLMVLALTITGQNFHRTSLYWNMTDVLLMIRQELCSGRRQRRYVLFHCFTKRSHMINVNHHQLGYFCQVFPLLVYFIPLSTVFFIIKSLGQHKLIDWEILFQLPEGIVWTHIV